jgi:hypothetical protein
MKIVLAIVAAVLACVLWVGRYRYEAIPPRIVRVNVFTGRACQLWPPAPKVNPYAAILNSPPKPDPFAEFGGHALPEREIAEVAFGDAEREARRLVGACE